MTLKDALLEKIQALYEKWRPEQVAAAREYLRAYEAGEETTEAGRAAYSWLSLLWVRIDDAGRLWPSFYAKDVSPRAVGDLGLEGLRFSDETGAVFEVVGETVTHEGAVIMSATDLINAVGGISAPKSEVL